MNKTERGFSVENFKDRYGVKCSIQKSSLATEDCIWLGVDDSDPRIMASKAAKHRVPTNQKTGWIEYPLSSDVLLNTRMHLSQEMVKQLLPILNKFAETGEL